MLLIRKTHKLLQLFSRLERKEKVETLLTRDTLRGRSMVKDTATKRVSLYVFHKDSYRFGTSSVSSHSDISCRNYFQKHFN